MNFQKTAVTVSFTKREIGRGICCLENKPDVTSLMFGYQSTIVMEQHHFDIKPSYLNYIIKLINLRILCILLKAALSERIRSVNSSTVSNCS